MIWLGALACVISAFFIGYFSSGEVRHARVERARTVHVQVLEKRVARLAAAFVVLLEAIDDGTANSVARRIWEELQRDMEPPI